MFSGMTFCLILYMLLPNGLDTVSYTHLVECEAADLVCKVAGDGLAVLHDLAVQIELGAALRQVIDGTIHVVAAWCQQLPCSER